MIQNKEILSRKIFHGASGHSYRYSPLAILNDQGLFLAFQSTPKLVNRKKSNEYSPEILLTATALTSNGDWKSMHDEQSPVCDMNHTDICCATVNLEKNFKQMKEPL